jgi:hypothetical protein
VDYDETIQHDKQDNKAFMTMMGMKTPKMNKISMKIIMTELTMTKLKTYLTTQGKMTIPTSIQKKMNKAQMKNEAKEGNDEAKGDNTDKETAVISKQETDLQGSALRRSTRESQPVSRLKPSVSGKLYAQDDKKKRKVAFAEDKMRQLDYCHNLVSQVKADTRSKLLNMD